MEAMSLAAARPVVGGPTRTTRGCCATSRACPVRCGGSPLLLGARRGAHARGGRAVVRSASEPPESSETEDAARGGSPAPAQPPSSELSSNQWAVITHLSALAGLVLPVGNILAPLVLWLVKKAEVPSLDQVGKDVLNFQISWSIYLLLSGLSMFFCIGVVLLPVAAIAWLVFLILGTIKASNGERYNFPLTIKFL